MIFEKLIYYKKKWQHHIDWKLFLLLLLFLNVKLAIKIPVILIVYLVDFNFRFGFRFKNSRLPLFYLFIIGIACLGMLMNRSYQDPEYVVSFLVGCSFWLLCLLAVHQMKLSVEKQGTAKIHRTILLFFVINALSSVGNLLSIIWETDALNPYLYQGQYQKYFIGTGDYIKGVTFDTSITNALINAMGIIYFLLKRNYTMTLVCMVILLLTGSNFVNIIVVTVFAYLCLFSSNREQKSIMVVCIMLLVVFMAKISPQNQRYIGETLEKALGRDTIHHPIASTVPLPVDQKPDSLLSPEEKKERIARRYLDSLSNAYYEKNRANDHLASNQAIIQNDNGQILLPEDDIHAAFYQSIKVPTLAVTPLQQFIKNHQVQLPYSSKTIPVPRIPGKAIGMLQTLKFMLHHPDKIIIGSGMGNFSSKLAFRTTGLGLAGGYPHQLLYINPDFMTNHLDLYLYFFSLPDSFHSLTNSPFSTYDQLLSEYGLIGGVVFAVFYLGYFLKHYKKLTYGLPLLLLMIMAFLTDYWFEQLSVLVLFELLLLLNLKETEEMVEEDLVHA